MLALRCLMAGALLAVAGCATTVVPPQRAVVRHDSSTASAQILTREPILVRGDVEAGSAIGSGCRGYYPENPTHSFSIGDNADELIVSSTSSSDTALIVRSPSGQFFCDDDSGEGLNPRLQIGIEETGEYNVWVGVVSPSSTGVNAELDVETRLANFTDYWPAPRPTDILELANLAAEAGPRSFSRTDNLLRANGIDFRASNLGYRWRSIPGGIAIITDLERIDHQGNGYAEQPAANRGFGTRPFIGLFDVGRWWTRIHGTERGFLRVFAIYVTTEPNIPTTQAAMAADIVDPSYEALPVGSSIVGFEVTPRHRWVAYLYEYEFSDIDHSAESHTSSSLGICRHMRRSGMFSAPLLEASTCP